MGGSSNKGYIDRYEAKDSASIDVNARPLTAFAIEYRIAHVVNTLVGRPRQVAIVKGLKRNLGLG